MSSALNTGAALVLADLDLASLCISPAAMEGLTKPLTKVVMSVHWHRAWAEMAALVVLCHLKLHIADLTGVS